MQERTLLAFVAKQAAVGIFFVKLTRHKVMDGNYSSNDGTNNQKNQHWGEVFNAAISGSKLSSQVSSDRQAQQQQTLPALVIHPLPVSHNDLPGRRPAETNSSPVWTAPVFVPDQPANPETRPRVDTSPVIANQGKPQEPYHPFYPSPVQEKPSYPVPAPIVFHPGEQPQQGNGPYSPGQAPMRPIYPVLAPIFIPGSEQAPAADNPKRPPYISPPLPVRDVGRLMQAIELRIKAIAPYSNQDIIRHVFPSIRNDLRQNPQFWQSTASQLQQELDARPNETLTAEQMVVKAKCARLVSLVLLAQADNLADSGNRPAAVNPFQAAQRYIAMSQQLDAAYKDNGRIRDLNAQVHDDVYGTRRLPVQRTGPHRVQPDQQNPYPGQRPQWRAQFGS